MPDAASGDLFDWEASDELTELSDSEEEGEDLDDLDDLDDDDKPLLPPRVPPPPSKKPKGTQASYYLQAPRTATISTESIFKKYNDGLLILDPPYQRDVVWSQEKQSNLIDSLIYHYCVFPIIISTSTDSDGGDVWTCIDGKQRLTSIIRFMSGDIPHKDSVTRKKFWFVNKDGKKKTLMPEAKRKNFEHVQIAYNQYFNLTLDQQRGVFQRVQNGSPLAPAERMQSLNGPGPEVVRRILSMYKPIFGSTPGAPQFKSVAQILLMIHTSPVQHQRRRTTVKAKSIEGEVSVSRIETYLQKATPIPTGIYDILMEVMDILWILAVHDKYNAPFKRKPNPTPLEYVLAAHLIHTRRTELSLEQLSALFGSVRKELRKGASDSKVSKALYSKVMKLIAAAVNDTNSTAAIVEKSEYPIKATQPNLRPVSGAKRERAEGAPESTPSAKKQKLSKAASDVKDSKSSSRGITKSEPGPSRGTKKRARDDDDDDAASIRPIKSVKSRPPASHTSVVGPTKAAGPSKAATTIKRAKTNASQSTSKPAAAQNASAKLSIASGSKPTASIGQASKPKATSSGAAPSSMAIPAPTSPQLSSCQGAIASSATGSSSQIASSRSFNTGRNVSTAGLSTVGTRTQDPRRKASLNAGSLATLPSPAIASSSSQGPSFVQSAKSPPHDPRPRLPPAQSVASQSQASQQCVQHTSASSLDPSTGVLAPSLRQVDQSSFLPPVSTSSEALFNINSIVTVSSPVTSASHQLPPCPYQTSGSRKA